MQTLGLSDSTPKTENRLKNLFWPAIKTGSDVSYLRNQGFWLCTALAVISFVFAVISGQPVVGVVIFLVCFLGGVGVREGSRYAATVVLLLYVADTLLSWQRLLLGLGPMVVRVLISALLFSNMRASWIASRWRPESEDSALPPRLDGTLTDKLADQLPMWLWPRVQILYYIFSAGFLLLVANGVLQRFIRGTR